MSRYLHHITLTTGHSRRSYRSECSDEAVAAVRGLITRARLVLRAGRRDQRRPAARRSRRQPAPLLVGPVLARACANPPRPLPTWLRRGDLA